MKEIAVRLFRLPIRSLAVAAAFLAGALPCLAQAQQIHTLASYTVSLAGVNVANVDIRLDIAGADYQLDLAADVAGLAQMVAQGTGAVNSGGVVTADGLRATRFYLETRTASDRFTVQSQFAGGNATNFSVNPLPANDAQRVPVTSGHRQNVNDPIAAFILRGPALSGDLCQRTMPIFTGLERFDVAMSFGEMQEATSARTGYQGPVVLCQMSYRPISGHFADSELTASLAGSRMLVWFAPLRDTGFFIPYRILISTSLGDLSMVLVRLDA